MTQCPPLPWLTHIVKHDTREAGEEKYHYSDQIILIYYISRILLEYYFFSSNITWVSLAINTLIDVLNTLYIIQYI